MSRFTDTKLRDTKRERKGKLKETNNWSFETEKKRLYGLR